MTLSASIGLATDEVRNWTSSAAIALIAHGLAVAALLPRAEYSTANAGSPVIMVEFAPQIVAPIPPTVDLPPGPLQTEQQAEEQVRRERQTETKTEQKVEEKIPEMNSPREPELQVPQKVETPSKERREDQREQQQIAERPAQTAPPNPTIIAALPAGPTAGQTPAPASKAFVAWQLKLVAHIERLKRYPREARPAQGDVNVAFTIDRKGVVVTSRIAKSSGSPVLDAEAMDLVLRSQPLPVPPADAPEAQLSQVATIRFQIGK